jgi:sulfate/thiosulfate transport system ATP-binding protein
VKIEVRSVSKRFGSFAALTDVSLTVESGELVALLGPSGSGKTSLLRVIAGLEPLDEGAVLFGDRDATERSARERNVGFVFQHYALFRHMTVFENVAFGLRVRPRRTRPSRAEIRQRVTALLELVQLQPMADRYPSQLSGGQRQRVALARALAVEPDVLLLDEPFGALDAKVRCTLRRWLRRLHDELRVTSVFVTHDQEEALELADRVVIMNGGRVEQVGTPEAVYAKPLSPFVYDFLGDVNVFRGRVDGGTVHLGDLVVAVPGLEAGGAHEARVYVRPHLLDLYKEANGGPEFPARIVHISAAGPLVKLELQADWGEAVRVEMPQERFKTRGLRPADRVFVRFSPGDLYVSAEDRADALGAVDETLPPLVSTRAATDRIGSTPDTQRPQRLAG